MASLNECMAEFAEWLAAVQFAIPPLLCSAECQLEVTIGGAQGENPILQATWCCDQHFACTFSWEETIPPNYCEEHPGMCVCAAELAQIAQAINDLEDQINVQGTAIQIILQTDLPPISSALEQMSLALGDTILSASSNILAVDTTLSGNLPGLANLGTIATANGLIATGVGALVATQSGIAVTEVAQSLSLAAVAVAQATQAVELAGVNVSGGSIALSLLNLSPIRAELAAVAVDTFRQANSVDGIQTALEEMRDCICAAPPSSSREYVRAESPEPTNSSVYPGGGPTERFMPLYGIVFFPDALVDGASTILQSIIWCSHLKSLIQFPEGGSLTWNYYVVGSAAILASEVTTSIVSL